MRKVLVNNISKIIFNEETVNHRFVLKKEKGNKHIVINFKFPFLHFDFYSENKYRDNWYYPYDRELYGETFLLSRNNNIICRNGKFYNKPYIEITYIDGDIEKLFFNDNESTKKKFDELKELFSLKEIK